MVKTKKCNNTRKRKLNIRTGILSCMQWLLYAVITFFRTGLLLQRSTWKQRFDSMLILTGSIHERSTLMLTVMVCGCCCHWARGKAHPGQMASLCHVLCFDYYVFRFLSCFQDNFLSCFFPCHLVSLKSPVFCSTAARHHQSPPHSIQFPVFRHSSQNPHSTFHATVTFVKVRFCHHSNSLFIVLLQFHSLVLFLQLSIFDNRLRRALCFCLVPLLE